MGISPADASIRIHRIRAGREQATACTVPLSSEAYVSLRTGNFPCTAKDQVRHVNHAMKRAAKMVHHKKFEFNINKTMRQEIDFFCKKLLPNSDIKWETPIPHIIPLMPLFKSFGDNCLEGAAGYSIPLSYWWHIPFPEEIMQCTLLHKKGQ